MKRVITLLVVCTTLSLNGMEQLKEMYASMRDMCSHMNLDHEHCSILKDTILPKEDVSINQLTEHQIAVSFELLNQQKHEEAADLIFLIQKAQVALHTPVVSKKLGELDLAQQHKEIVDITKTLFAKYQPLLEQHKDCKECPAGKLGKGKAIQNIVVPPCETQ